ncbi:phage tail tape measure protein [uncultured Dubosiella sp.]|uniref:phage tail tape measure protein n=2 Tax=uncultured Dubosiella sp. TaxID=1937011 RepID=UPI0025B4A45E|nr:phage tail tape measure protein [uncultured Dubosiella sp.]
MAGMDIGPRISLKGQQEFRKQINGVNSDLKTYGSELKKVSAEMDASGKSVELLQKANSLLEKQYETQEKKLQIYQEQLEKHNRKLADQAKNIEALKAKYGEQSKEVAKAQREYEATSSEIDKLNYAINETQTYMIKTSKAIETNRGSLSDLGSATDALKSKISAQEQALKQAQRAYADYILVHGKAGTKAQDLQADIQRLSSELNQNKARLNEVESEATDLAQTLDETADRAREASDGFTVMKVAMADLVSEGIQKGAEMMTNLAGSMKDFALESDSSYKKFQAQTGASKEELAAFKAEMDDLYANNFGESLGDLGDKMAYVKQVTGEVDPSNIRKLVENAITLEDTFGSDFSETVRGVNNLMQHFGITSEEAFDLFARGSQLGLDYTGELGDNVAEYSGNFAQAGYSAEEYFQLLVNGSHNGAYNLDKVNDAINEAKNRLGDGSIGESIDLFSSSTKNLYAQWERGEATMKDVIESIVSDINSCTDEQDALTMAAAAFGTMGEDANLAVVGSLTSVGNELDDVNGKMDELKQQRYDDVQSQLEGLGRQIQMDVITPIAETLLPLLKDVISFVSSNLPALLPIIALFGATLAGAFVINGISNTISSIQNIIGLVQGLPSLLPILEGIKGAVSSLFGLIMAHPVVAVITVVIGAIVALYTKCEWFRDAVNAVLQSIGDFFTQVFEGMVVWFSETLPNAFAQFKDSLVDGWNRMCESLGQKWNDFWAKVKQIMDTIIGFVRDNWQGLLLLLVNPFAGAFKLLYDNCAEFRNFVDTWISKIGSIISDTLGGFWSKAKNWGADLINGFVEGIKSGIQWVKDTVSGIAKTVADFLHFSVPDKGPLSDFDESGGDMIDLFVKGMKAKKNDLMAVIRDFAEMLDLNTTMHVDSSRTMRFISQVFLDKRKIAEATNEAVVDQNRAMQVAQGG